MRRAGCLGTGGQSVWAMGDIPTSGAARSYGLGCQAPRLSARVLGSQHKARGLAGPRASAPLVPLGSDLAWLHRLVGCPAPPECRPRGHAPLPQHPALSGWSGSTWGLREPGSPAPAIRLGKAPEPLTPTLQPRVGRPHLPTHGRTAGWNKAYSRNPGHTPGVGVGAVTAQRGSA